ncbi:MAG: helix-turn-helix transcriptional regulator [Hyphomicrobiales bacterium]|nr:helix-turn-helix transcriptional regulator [Hyphomicrobiales bacterium]MBV8827152.1 helix-turn-helix transcriptional regulator [Hyphomicrobiales bacterium]MBV9427950.1 helix-turn-helix transcriptional regulator [Bradyrhizobiaceae bacterium]
MPKAKRDAKRPSSIDIAVGRNVRIWRMARGMSQAQLASRLGVTFQQLQKYEVGANRIGTGRLVKVATMLSIPIQTLFEGTDTDPARSVLALVADARAFRLAQAFKAIDNSTLRLSVVYLVEKIAAAVPQPERRKKRSK